ncbi:hypothetical protein [Paenisporosarcina indica]|nr:hypothetical protein [Paenisporosarcina indica]
MMKKIEISIQDYVGLIGALSYSIAVAKSEHDNKRVEKFRELLYKI